MKANWTVIIIKISSSIKGIKFKKTVFFNIIWSTYLNAKQ